MEEAAEKFRMARIERNFEEREKKNQTKIMTSAFISKLRVNIKGKLDISPQDPTNKEASRSPKSAKIDLSAFKPSISDADKSPMEPFSALQRQGRKIDSV